MHGGDFLLNPFPLFLKKFIFFFLFDILKQGKVQSGNLGFLLVPSFQYLTNPSVFMHMSH